MYQYVNSLGVTEFKLAVTRELLKISLPLLPNDVSEFKISMKYFSTGSVTSTNMIFQ